MSEEHIRFFNKYLGDNEEEHKRIYHSLKARTNARRTSLEKMADSMTSFFGSNVFLWGNTIVFVVWILVNTKMFDFFGAFDPYPFSFLTMVVSLEAIILSVFVLISQNRTAKFDDLREETHLQLNLISEREITKIIKMLDLLLKKNGIDLSSDPELNKMLRPLNEEEIEKNLEKEIL